MSTDTRFDLSLDPRGLSRTGLSVWPDTRGHGHRVSVHRTAPARRGSHRAAGGRGAHAGASGRDIQEPASRRRVFLPARATGRIFTRDCDDRMITVCRSLPRCKGSMGRRPDIAHEEPAGGAAAHCVAGVGQELLVQYFIRKWVLQC